MKVCICTTPIRPIPTTFPPHGSMAIIQSLRVIGIDASFYNIDYFRPTLKDVERYFELAQYDVVGISAVVSTAYAYTKILASIIRRASPKTIIVVGGNMAASAEILLRKSEVDYCVTGDGEFIVRELFTYLELNSYVKNDDLLKEVKGIAFLDSSGKFIFTGHGQRPDSDEIEYPDYSILEKDGSIDYFIYEQATEFHSKAITNSPIFAKNMQKAYATGLKRAHVTVAKGCVARCTFCHRWEKGYRPRSVEDVVNHITMLRDRYGVGIVVVADENFGADRKLTRLLAVELGKLGIGWVVAGVRARTVNLSDLQLWAENGCMTAYFGIESGSAKILEIMEKQATVQENLDALRWTSEAGLATTIQLVLGMPGEDDETIGETISFLQKASEFLLEWKDMSPSELISINYAQALPGTPLYEFARELGHIGNSIDSEEGYLLGISDVDAYKEDHFINYTGLPMLKVLIWRPRILAEVDAYAFSNRTGIKKLSLISILKYYFDLIMLRIMRKWSYLMGVENRSNKPGESQQDDGGYFNIHRSVKFFPILLNPLTKKLFYPLVAVAFAFNRGGSFPKALNLLFEHVAWSLGLLKIEGQQMPAKSLRKIISIKSTPSETDDEMLPLRLGR